MCSKRGFMAKSAQRSRICAITRMHCGLPEKQETKSRMAASLSHSIWTRLPRSKGANCVSASRMPSSSKKVVDSRKGAKLGGSLSSRPFVDEAFKGWQAKTAGAKIRRGVYPDQGLPSCNRRKACKDRAGAAPGREEGCLINHRCRAAVVQSPLQ